MFGRLCFLLCLLGRVDRTYVRCTLVVPEEEFGILNDALLLFAPVERGWPLSYSRSLPFCAVFPTPSRVACFGLSWLNYLVALFDLFYFTLHRLVSPNVV